MTPHDGIYGAVILLADPVFCEEQARVEVAGHLAHRYLTSSHCEPGSLAWVSACQAVDEAEELGQ